MQVFAKNVSQPLKKYPLTGSPEVISAFTLDGGSYRTTSNITHNFGASHTNIIVKVERLSGGSWYPMPVGFTQEAISVNELRLWFETQPTSIRIFLIGG